MLVWGLGSVFVVSWGCEYMDSICGSGLGLLPTSSKR